MGVKIEHILFIILVGFAASFILFFIFVNRKNIGPSVLTVQNNDRPEKILSDSGLSAEFHQKINEINKSMNALSQAQASQASTLNSIQKSPDAKVITGKKILGVVKSKVGLVTTSSGEYTPLGMYVNITCASACNLWLNFYSTSKNLSTPSSAQGFLGTYGLFVDNTDQSTTSQVSFPVQAAAVPVALNALVSVGAGTHSVEVRAKTDGGTLESDTSFLQVMAMEQ